MRAPARRIGLGVVLLCLFANLLVGLAIKAPCASGDWGDGKQYRSLCYSDLVPLLFTEQLQSGNRLPLLDPCRDPQGECDEYPVLTMYTMRLAAWLTPTSAGGGAGPIRSTTGFFYANVVLLTIAAAAIAVCIYLMVGSRALLFALAPTLLVYAYVNWDLIAVALATAATLAYLNRRDVAAGVLLGIGAAAKFYPALLVVPFLLGRFHEREPDRGIHLAWGAASAWTVVNLPFALASPGSWWEFFGFSATRPADWDSLWFIACHRIGGDLSCGGTRLINMLSAALLVGGAVLVWRLRRRRDPGFPRWTFGLPLLVVFLLTNKVYSPQYGLWLLPWFALTLPEMRVWLAFGLSDVAVFVTRFSWFGRYGGFGGLPIGAFELAVLVRAGVLVWVLVAWVRRGRGDVAAPASPEEIPAEAAA